MATRIVCDACGQEMPRNVVIDFRRVVVLERGGKLHELEVEPRVHFFNSARIDDSEPDFCAECTRAALKLVCEQL